MWIRAAGEDSITKGEYCYVSRAWQDIVGGGAQMKYEELSLSFRDCSYVLGKVAALGGK